MCNFDGPWFGASYPDAICVGGYLHDADADGYDPNDVSHPCPRCNTKQYLVDEKEESDGTELLGWGTGAGMTYVTGDQIWEIAKKWARQENPAEADGLITDLERNPHPTRAESHALSGGRRVQHGGWVRVVRVEAISDAEAEREGEVMSVTMEEQKLLKEVMSDPRAKELLQDKARWECCSLFAVLRGWGDPRKWRSYQARPTGEQG